MREPEPECWLHPDVEVRPSDVAGRGLFARADLPARTPVSRLGGRLVDTATVRDLIATSAAYVDTVVVDEDTHLLWPPATTGSATTPATPTSAGSTSTPWPR